MPSDELKPCPFCGAPAEIHHASTEYELMVIVECSNLFCKARIWKGASRDMSIIVIENNAVAAWNRRAEEGGNNV